MVPHFDSDDFTNVSSISIIEDINSAESTMPPPYIIEPILYKTLEEIDFPFIEKRTKRRKFKSYFGKSYEQSN